MNPARQSCSTACSPHANRAAIATTVFDSLGEALRKAIRDSPQPAAEIAAKAHLSPLALSKFLAGERDIHLETADRLAEVLGIKLASS